MCLKDPLLSSEMRVQAFLGLCAGLDADPGPSAAANAAAKKDTRSRLSQNLLDFFCSRRQSSGTFRRKVDYWLSIDRALRSRWPQCRTLAFGSTLSGFGTNSSDMDLCVFFDHAGEQQENASKKVRQKGTVEFLTEIRRMLR